MERTSKLPKPLSVTIAGLNKKRNASMGRATAREVPSGRWMARLFGASSPRTMWRTVMIVKAMIAANV